MSQPDPDVALALTKAWLETAWREQSPPFIRYPHQVRPLEWSRVWLAAGGRGNGKTRLGVEESMDHLREFGSDAWVTIIGPTIGNTQEVCIDGESGLYTLYGHEFESYNQSKMVLRHKDGGRVKAFGAEKPDRLRGPQSTFLWADELCTWERPETWTMALLGLRIGVNPRALVTTTFKPRRFIRKLREDPRTVITCGTTFDNPALSSDAVEDLRLMYDGTRIGRQELYGEYIEDLTGAMWKRDWFETGRKPEHPGLKRVVVAVDPAVTAGEDADETAIAVAGLGQDGEYYVLEASGHRMSPKGWADEAVAAWKRWRDYSPIVVAERNQGGDMVTSTLRQAHSQLPIRTIHASKGKRVRAEPVALAYEQGRVHHVGMFAELEDQMCAFPVDSSAHDDRLDAVVYAITELMGGNWGEIKVKSEGY